MKGLAHLEFVNIVQPETDDSTTADCPEKFGDFACDLLAGHNIDHRSELVYERAHVVPDSEHSPGSVKWIVDEKKGVLTWT